MIDENADKHAPAGTTIGGVENSPAVHGRLETDAE